MGFKPVNKTRKRIQKHRSVRKNIHGTAERPRLAVFKSARNIYAQLIDDDHQKTITGVSTLTKALQDDLAKAKSKRERAEVVGKAIAAKAKELKIEQVVFDRGGFVYHGRIKALADAAREGGLKF
ncbi:MAG TPA: 50S ribosomal protein L18 [Bacteroidetes bacterium]|nr:50S ribosomal protein L18 [Bacteroidota bacterium]